MAVVAPPSREALPERLRDDEAPDERWALWEERPLRAEALDLLRCWRPPLTGVAQYGHTVHMGSSAFLQRAQRFFSCVWQFGHST